MTILLPDTSATQTVNYIPRYNSSVATILLTDEQENVEFSASLVSESVLEYYNEVSLTLGSTLLKEGRTYMIVFKDSLDKILFTDKVYSTSQPISTFSVNEGVYTIAPATSNDYIIYE